MIMTSQPIISKLSNEAAPTVKGPKLSYKYITYSCCLIQSAFPNLLQLGPVGEENVGSKWPISLH